MQGMIVALMVLAALYGIAQLMMKATLRLLRPRFPRMTMVLSLKGRTDDAEQQVRYACAVAREQRCPLVVSVSGCDEETVRIVRTALKGRNVTIVSEETCGGRLQSS